MSLLVDIMSHSLDEAYLDAAEYRSTEPRLSTDTHPGARPAARRRSLPTVAVLLLAGLLAGTAAAQLRAPRGGIPTVRSQLLAEVRHRTGDTDSLAATLQRLRHATAAARSAGLQDTTSGRALAARLDLLDLVSAEVPVTGPGLLVRLDDAPGATPGGTGSAAGRVQDRDVQEVVNALWAAGAEAIGVNGERLGPQSSIRSAGEAILVDYRPLAPPYLVAAAGDSNRLAAGFADSAVARRFTTYTSLYGIGFRFAPARRLVLGAASPPDLHLVRTG